jgi:hypothetical protein
MHSDHDYIKYFCLLTQLLFLRILHSFYLDFRYASNLEILMLKSRLG